MVANASSLVDSLYAYGILHVVVVETCVPQQLVVALGRELSLRHGVGSVGYNEVLLALLGCCKAYGNDVGGITCKVVAAVHYAVLAELDVRQSRIQRQLAAIARHANAAKSGLHVQLAGCGEASEARRCLVLRAVSHLAVEVLACQHVRLLPVVVGKCLTYILEHMCRLLVNVPVVGSPFLGVRSATPERFLVECQSFGLH